MYHSLPKHKQRALTAFNDNEKNRWVEAIKFQSSCEASQGFTTSSVRKYLMYLKQHGFIKSYTLKNARKKGGQTTFTLGRITKGMNEFPEKYPHSIILLGAAPRTDVKPKLRTAMDNGVSTFEMGRKRRKKKPYSKERMDSQKIKLYQSLPLLGSDKYTHAVGVAWTTNQDGIPKIGLYDNGRRRVVEFNVEDFRLSLVRFWGAVFFDIDV